MKTYLLTLLFACFSTTLSAQEPGGALDFWTGSWDLRWQDTDTSYAIGTNTISKVLDGMVIEENFTAINGTFAGYLGRSWSVFDSRNKIWKQTWVDNQGGYLDFTGGPEGDTFVFRRTGSLPNGKTIQQKMVFHDIKPDRFTWDWMSSNDGETWKLLWQIEYSRRKQ